VSGRPTVPVDIVGGFLGSGKTTLLRRLLEQGTGERVAVVVNELGEIGIDGLVVGGLGFGERMVELSSGCICCQLDTVHFEIALDELCDDVEPDRIVIETSGVAEPGTLARRLADLGRPLGSVITVADTVNLDHILSEPVGRDQIAAADFLVLSKLDLPETVGPAAAETRLRALNGRAVLLPGPIDAGGLSLLFGSGLAAAGSAAPAPAGWAAPAPTGPPGADVDDGRGVGAPVLDLESVSWRSDRPLDRRATLECLGALPPAIYRAKGVVRYAGASVPALVNVTAGRLQSQWEPALADAAGPGGALVFIGRDLPGWRDGLLAALDACIARETAVGRPGRFRGTPTP
jgi:G3E family GTPase